jgi:hypothetical protein
VAAAFRRQGEYSLGGPTMGIGSKASRFACALGLSFGLIGVPAANTQRNESLSL